jgi:hypothetical protein
LQVTFLLLSTLTREFLLSYINYQQLLHISIAIQIINTKLETRNTHINTTHIHTHTTHTHISTPRTYIFQFTHSGILTMCIFLLFSSIRKTCNFLSHLLQVLLCSNHLPVCPVRNELLRASLNIPHGFQTPPMMQLFRNSTEESFSMREVIFIVWPMINLICFLTLSPYRAVNTLRLSYPNRSVNVV